MSTVFFSVLIPVYNTEKYLRNCIESVIRQTFKDFEIILVNDGSADNSLDICLEYNEKYPFVKVIDKQNEGLVATRRIAIENAKGKYFCFLDSDDAYENNMLEKLFCIIEETDTDIISFKWKRIDENDREVHAIDASAFNETGLVSKEQYFSKVISTSYLNSLCLKCCKAELFDIGVDYSKLYSVTFGEDILQSLPLIEKAESFYYINEALYCYRVNTQSMTRVFNSDNYKTMNVVRPRVYESMCRLGFDNDKNIKKFYKMYLHTLWDHIVSININVKSRKEIKIIMEDLRSFTYVVQAKKYVDDVCETKFQRNGLKLFYTNSNVLRCYIIMCKVVNKLKSGRL